MSISKIEAQIEELEKKLQAINTNIADPIERNEYKRELHKQIKKLTKTKTNLEKLQQEQEELESLKTEFLTSQTLANSSTAEQTQPEVKQNHLTSDNCIENKQDNIEIQTIDNWKSPVTTNYEQWDDNCQFYQNSTELTKNKPQSNHLIYLSERAIWISTIFAIWSFFVPYIYTRRWKPLFILLIGLGLATAFTSQQKTIDLNNSKKEIYELTDRTFYSRYPELRGRKIRDDETFFKKEWLRIRDCEGTVDYLFYQRHPELGRKTVLPGEKRLAQEWLQIKRNTRGCN